MNTDNARRSWKSAFCWICLVSAGIVAVLFFRKPADQELAHTHSIPEYELSLKYPKSLLQLFDIMGQLDRNRNAILRSDDEIAAAADYIVANAKANPGGIVLADLFRTAERETSKGFNWLPMLADRELEDFLSSDIRSLAPSEVAAQIRLCLGRRQQGKYKKFIESSETDRLFRMTGVKPPLMNKDAHCLDCINLWIDDLVKDDRKIRMLPACALYRVINNKKLAHIRLSGIGPSFKIDYRPKNNGRQKYGKAAKIDASILIDVPTGEHSSRVDTGLSVFDLKPVLAESPAQLLENINRDQNYMPIFTALEDEAEYYIRKGQFHGLLRSLGIPAASKISKPKVTRVDGGFKVSFVLAHSLKPKLELIQDELLLTRLGLDQLRDAGKRIREAFLAETRKQVLPGLQQVDGFKIKDVRVLPEYSRNGNILAAKMELDSDISSMVLLSLDAAKDGNVRLVGTISAEAQQKILSKLIDKEGLAAIAGQLTILNCRMKAKGVLGGDIRVGHVGGEITIPWEFTSGSFGLKYRGNAQRVQLQKIAENAGEPALVDEAALRKKLGSLLREKLGVLSNVVNINAIRARKDGGTVAWSVKVADWPEISVDSILPGNPDAKAMEAFLAGVLDDIKEASRRSWNEKFYHPRFGRVTASIEHIVTGNKSGLDFRINVKPAGDFKDTLEWVDLCRRIESKGWEVLDEAKMQNNIGRVIQRFSDSFIWNINEIAGETIVKGVYVDKNAYGQGKWLKLSPLTMAFRAEVKIPNSTVAITAPFTWSIEEGIKWKVTRLIAKPDLAELLGIPIKTPELDINLENQNFRIGGVVPLDGGSGMASLEANFDGNWKDSAYGAEAGLDLLGEGRVGYFKGRLKKTPTVAIDAQVETVENSYVDWIGMKGAVKYEHSRQMSGEVDFSLGLMTRAGGGIGLHYKNGLSQIDRLRLKGTASFPVLSFLPVGITLLGDARRPPKGQQFGLKDLELVGKASVNLFLTAGTVTAWADHNNGIKKIRFSWEDTNGKRLNFDLDNATAESMTAEELQRKIKKVMVDHLEKEQVDKALAESPEGQALKNLIKKHFHEKDGKYRLNKDANSEAIDKIVQAFSKENKQRERKGKKIAFLGSPSEMSEEEKELASRLPENKAFNQPEPEMDVDIKPPSRFVNSGNDSSGDMPPLLSDLKVERTNDDRVEFRQEKTNKLLFGFSCLEARLDSSQDYGGALTLGRHKGRGYINIFLDSRKNEFRILEYKNGKVISILDINPFLKAQKPALLNAFLTARKSFLNDRENKAKDSINDTYQYSILQYGMYKSLGKENQIDVNLHPGLEPMVAITRPDKELVELNFANESGFQKYLYFKKAGAALPGRQLQSFLQNSIGLPFREHIDQSHLITHFSPAGNNGLIIKVPQGSGETSEDSDEEPTLLLFPFQDGKLIREKPLSFLWEGEPNNFPHDQFAGLSAALTQNRGGISGTEKIYFTDAGFCFLIKPDDQGSEGRIVFWAAAEPESGVVSVNYRKFVEGLDARPDLIQRLPNRLREKGQRRLMLDEPRTAERLARELVTKRIWKGTQEEEDSGWKSNPLGVLLNLVDQ